MTIWGERFEHQVQNPFWGVTGQSTFAFPPNQTQVGAETTKYNRPEIEDRQSLIYTASPSPPPRGEDDYNRLVQSEMII